MSDKLYNIIMHSNPEFWAGSNAYVDFPKDRFLEHTTDDIKSQFQSLDQEAINELKKLPTLFAVEHENADTRIGKVVNVEVQPKILRVKYQFSNDHYPLTKGVLQKNWQKLGIDKAGFEFYRTHWAVKACDITSFYEEYLKTLTGIAHQLKAADKKVQLIYAFNGTGKTRLSREFKDLIAPKNTGYESEEAEPSRNKILYYNAFTEDLFYWDNDLKADAEPKLKIQPNTFIDWIIGDRGQDQNITDNFQHYSNNKITPTFQEKDIIHEGKKTGKKTYPEVNFSLDTGTERTGNLKISKGEESNFVWSIFYTLLEEVISIRNEPDPNKRDDNQFDQLEYVFIDDPVSSLDDNHLIELAVHLAELVKGSDFSNGQGLKFIITTHSPLFYNVLHNELNNKAYKPHSATNGLPVYKPKHSIMYRLDKKSDGSFVLEEQPNDSPFSYHLFLLSEIKSAIKNGQIKKYHFNFLRNILEKTATFLGHKRWHDLLPKNDSEDPDPFAKRILNLSSHSAHSGEEITAIEDKDRENLEQLVNYLTETYKFCQEKQLDG